jgi:gluconokinase
MNKLPLIWIMMGVSGSGKTTLGRLFAEFLECDFLEGDRRHSRENIKKMSNKKALDDKDRGPWLSVIADDIRQSLDRGQEIVLTCSALKQSYRKELALLGQVQFIYLKVEKSLLEKRLIERPNHFMTVEMLHGQLDTLDKIQPEENVITMDGNLPIDAVISALRQKVEQDYPDLTKPWWKRYLE